MLPDGNGGWQVGETTESTIREDGKNRTSDGRISRRHSDGNCHGFCGQSQASGQNTSTVETHRWASVLENYFGRGLVDASSKKSARGSKTIFHEASLSSIRTCRVRNKKL